MANLVVVSIFLCSNLAQASAGFDNKFALNLSTYQALPDSGDKDTLKYPLKDSPSTSPEGNQSKMDVKDPANIKTEVKYNPETGKYEVTQKMGDINYRPPTYMDFDEYMEYTKKKTLQDYWRDKQSAENEFEDNKSKAFKPSLKVKSRTFDRIFGGNNIDIKPSGSAELSFGLRISKTENPVIPVRNRRITTFQFDQNMQINLVGSIGDKMKVTTNYNTQATFDFQNQFKIDYTGYEDEIIQKIELGNVTMPLNSQLITGSQSLFGVKTKLKFGRLTMTTVLSQDRGQKSEIETQGGAQVSEFEVKADNYEANKHFFLDEYFRDVYEHAVGDPMVLKTGVNITRVEIWTTNTRTNGDAPRDIIAFQDMGTAPNDVDPSTNLVQFNVERYYNPRWQNPNVRIPYPDNNSNYLYSDVNGPNGFNGNVSMDLAIPILQQKMNLDPRMDFQKVEFAKKLQPNEYVLHPQLGYISLKQQINTNQVLAVAYQYTVNGQVYQVGEFSDEVAEKPLLVKMLKSTEINTKTPMWKLMMKNVYSIGAYRVKKDGFRFNVWYLDQNKGVDINFLPQPEINDMSLVQLLGMDSLDFNGAKRSDGIFDFVEGITINTQNGRIIIPRLEPFGDGLRTAFEQLLGDPVKVEAYMRLYGFDSLYTNTQADAKVRWPERNRFSLKGKYQSESSNEIPLNALNVPEGSVTVTAGGQVLTENQDYTVDYNMGKVKIINQSIIESGLPIKVSLESNQLFAQQQKNFLGHRMEYKISDDFLIGGTLMHLWERPLTQKVDIGYEPISNWVWGLDLSYRSDLPWLTRAIDKIPLIDTKEKSTISVSGEFAQLLPGHSKAIGKDGNSYIDDFEGSQNSINLQSWNAWHIASTPREQIGEWPEGELFNNQANGINRALLNWRVVDPSFYDNGTSPNNVINDQAMLSNHFMRQVFQQEVFPERQIAAGQISNISMFDLSFYPNERGPYNFDADGRDSTGRVLAAGIDSAGFLKDPASRWGGITRRIDQNDFEASNIEYIQFWVMDPFNDDYEGTQQDGKLIFNLGNISEDVMYDGQKVFEHLLPNNAGESNNLNPAELTKHGRITPGNAYALGFDNDPATRPWQDIGLDGLKSTENEDQEKNFNQAYLDKVETIVDNLTFANIENDPAGDDYHYYFGTDYDNASLNILDRYKKFNGLEGNSPTDEGSPENYPTSANTLPDKEDINNDNTINQTESYYQYIVDISQAKLNPESVGDNYIADVLRTTVSTVDGNKRPINWYLIRIPVRTPKRTRHGNIQDLRSVYFMRMMMKGFTNPMHLRFARLELVRGEWRKYLGEIDDNPDGIATDFDADFTIGAVNVEENSKKIPINYVLPPDIEREINVNTTSLQQINEQSLQLTVCDLADGTGQAAFKNTNLDLRMYGRLKMYVHGESLADQAPINDDELSVFIRMGSDFTDNYYEYELPLKVSPHGEHSPSSVWPSSNNIDIELKALTDLKLQRDREVLDGASGLTSKRRYAGTHNGGAIYVVGNPNLGEVQTIMIGIKNPRRTPGDPNDDGAPKCAEVWVNELRLSQFDKTKGWATVGQANLKLADLANVVVSGGYSTPGWGSVDKKVNERQKETRKNYSATAAVNLDKFFPEKWGISLPMYASYSADIKDPQFSPLAPDIRFKDYVKQYDTKTQQDSVKKIMQDRTIRKAINFTNVRKEKNKNKKVTTPLDISNFSVSYSYAEENNTDFEVERDLTQRQTLGLTYSYGLSPKPIKPLSKVKLLRESKYLRLAREMNFYLLPKSFSFNTNMNRVYNVYQMRNNNPGLTANLPAFYNKQFTWNRTYNFKYDLTKNLKFDFNANNQSLIQEPDGAAGRDIETDADREIWRNAVWEEIQNFGTRMDYNHSSNFRYKLPLDLIPATDWINSSFRYGATYSWKRAPLGRETIGNTIQNSNNISMNGNFNFRRLYTKWGYLKKVEQRARRHQQLKARPKQKKPKEPAKPLDKNADGEEDPNAKKKKEKKPKSEYSFTDRLAKFLMTVNSGGVTYSRTRGTMIPGWGQDMDVLGLNQPFSSNPAPGWGFIFGQQYETTGDNTFWRTAADNGWLEKENGINYRFTQTYSENITYRLSAEPIRDVRITINGSRRESWNYSLFYRYSDSTQSFHEESPVKQGNLSLSYWSMPTALLGDGSATEAVFDQFLANRTVISSRLAENDVRSTGDHEVDPNYKEGYGPTSADVLIPSFLAAYGGKDANTQKLNVFQLIPAINYRINYNGLSKIPAVKKVFRSVTLNSGYSSNLTVGGYMQNQRYGEKDPISGDPILDLDSNFYSRYQYNSITISENFSPLINVDMQWQNKLSTRFEYKKGRTVGLNVGSAQVMEQRNETYTVGLGYQFRLKLPWEIDGKQLNEPMKLRGDMSYRKNKTVIRKIADESHTPTSGQNILSVKVTADYPVTKSLNIRLFYDYVLNIPQISNTFKTANTNFGFSIRFSIS